jgi:hypothetical protein
VHFTDLVGDAGVEQDALGRRRLAGIDVGHDADIAVPSARREAARHRLLAALARGLDQPAHRQRLAAGGTHFDRHLVGGATDAARLHLDHRATLPSAFSIRLDGIGVLVFLISSIAP